MQSRPPAAASLDRPVRFFTPFDAVIVVSVLGVLALMVIMLIPTMDSGRKRGRSPEAENLSSLTMMMLARSLDREQGYPPYSGRAFVLAVIADGIVDPGAPGALDVFFSPKDDSRGPRPFVEEYQALTPARLKAGGDFYRFTSYVGRRNADPDARFTRNSPDGPILADLVSHPHGAYVAFRDGRVEYLKRAELGLGPDEPMVAGPTSRSPILRLLGD